MTENRKFEVPLTAKIGWVVTWILMVVILAMLGRNLIGSFIFGIGTDKRNIDSYYDVGLSDAKEGEESRLLSLKLENPLYKKAYKKGFRIGLDQKWQAEKK